MNKMWYNVRRMLSVMLVVAMTMTTAPVGAFAEGVTNVDGSSNKQIVSALDTTTAAPAATQGGSAAAVPSKEAPAAAATAPAAATTAPAATATAPAATAPAATAPAATATAPAATATAPAATATTPAAAATAPAAAPAPAATPAPVYHTVTFVGFNGAVLATQSVLDGASAEAPNVPNVDGYVFAGWDKAFTNVTADLTVTASYKKLGTFTATVNYYFSDGTVAAQPFVEEVQEGAAYSRTVTSPTVTGFTPDKASVTLSAAAMGANITETVTYTGTAKNYTVKHMVQSLADEAAYELRDTETLAGTVGLMTQAAAKPYEGFTAQAITNVKVAANGDTVIVIQYTRNSYLLTYDSAGGSYVEAVRLKYGAAIPAVAAPTRIGYTFTGWTYSPAVGTAMPASDVTATAGWANATKASYTVVYWQEKVPAADASTTAVPSTATGYDYKESYVVDNAAVGTVLTAASAQARTYEGFVRSTANNTGSVTVAADGSTVLNVYYDRGVYTLKFYKVNRNGSAGSEYTSKRITAKYGQDISAKWQAVSDTRWATTPGGGTYYTMFSTMPAENINMYDRGTSSGNKVIIYYTETLSGTWQAFQTFSNQSFSKLTTEDQMPIAGFSYSDWQQYPGYFQDLATGDWQYGSWLSYTRSSYDVTFENCTGIADASVKYQAPLSGARPSQTPGKPAGVDSDSTFAGWYYDPAFQHAVVWTDTMPSHNVQIYAKWAKAEYTVSFDTKGGTPASIDPIGVAKYATVENSMPADPTREGYTFDGWYTDEAYTSAFVLSQQITHNYTLYAKWQKTGDYPYTVKCVDEAGTQLGTTAAFTGAAGATITVYAPSIEGYLPTVVSQSVSLDDANGKEVVFTYTKLASWTATVHYVDAEGNKIAGDATMEVTANVKVVSYKAFEGYELTSAPLVTIDHTKGETEATFTYAKIQDAAYKVVHHYGSTTQEESFAGTVGTMVTATPKYITGYNTCATTGNALSGIVRRDGSLVIDLYYTADAQTYTVNYLEKGTDKVLATAKSGTGSYGETLNESAAAVPGYTPDEQTKSITLGADNAANVLTFYYTVNSHALTIHYVYADGATAAADYTASLNYGAAYSVDSPVLAGYTASELQVAGTMPDADKTVTVTYSANSNTRYTVVHHYQDIVGDEYGHDKANDTDNLTGTTGAATAAAAKTVAGFTAKTFEQKTIAGDGSTVVDIYYDRISYNVTYSYTNDVPGESALPAAASYRYGASVTVAADATAPGYTFSGWSRTGSFAMPTADVTITGSFTANGDTAYTVEHYTENLDGSWKLEETQNLTGETGATASAAPKTYTGFTYDASVSGSKATGTIAGDGSLVLKLYYTRNSYDVTYSYTGTVPADASALPAAASYKYGASVTVAANATAAGYTFSGWSRKGSFEMPAESVSITGSFTANANTQYTVKHYTENLDGTYGEPRDTEHLTGTTDTTARAVARTYTGFTYDSTVEGTVVSGTIAGDGSLVLKLYYTRNSYDVTYSYTGTVPADASALPATVSYKYEQSVTVAAGATAAGYTFSGWSRPENFTMPAENVSITGSFTANADTQYTVVHHYQDIVGDGYGADRADETETLTGTTDTLTAAAARTVTGFTAQPFEQANIAGDGSTVVDIYYNRDIYTVTYTYTGTVPAGAGEVPAAADYRYGAQVTVAGTPTTPAGYTFSGWSRTDSFTMPAENVTINGSFTANGNTAYTIEHYTENLDGTTWDLHETEHKTAQTDTTVTAASKTYDGFTFDANAAGTVMSGTVAGNGSLVLKLYYTRNSYKVTYSYTGSVPADASALPAEANYKYGASVTVAGNAAAAGYTFSGWSRTDFTMPAENVSITGSFTANTDTAYTVVHHYQDIVGDGYDADKAADSESRTGTTGALTAAAAKTVTGFTAQSFAQATIAGDGSTVVNIYYNRNIHSVRYEYTGIVPAGAGELPGDASYRFGAPVEVAGAPTAPAGYTFSGWDHSSFDMQNEDVVIRGSFTANTDTAYTVEYYWQNIADDDYTVHETSALQGTTGATVTAAQKSYSGFTYVTTADTLTSGTIAGNGSLVLRLYYNRNSYEVSYAYAGTVPAGASTLPGTVAYRYGDAVTVAQAATAPGYTFNGWSTGNFTMPAAPVTITGSFTANADTQYTVIHHYQNIANDEYGTDKADETETLTGTTDTLTAAVARTVAGFTAQPFEQANIAGDGSTVVDIYYNRDIYTVTYTYTGTVPAGAGEVPAAADYRYGAQVTVAGAPTTPAGYTFNGWSAVDFTMPATDVTISGSFTANGNTAYTIEHYTENLDGTYGAPRDTEHLTGETDTAASAAARTYTGFTYDSTVEGTVVSGTIAGDGSLVLKLYYTRNSYDVTYSYTGIVPADASTLPAAVGYKYEQPVTVADNATATGYTFNGWSTGDFTMPAENVSITGSFTINNYAVRTEYYYDNVINSEQTASTQLPYNSTYSVEPANTQIQNGVNYTLDWVGNNGLTVTTDEGANVIRVYYATDEIGGPDGPDNVPDYAQIVFTYASADTAKGTVDGALETHNFARLNGQLTETKQARPNGAQATALEGNAFDYWTDGTQRDLASDMAGLKANTYTDNAAFIAYFDTDVKGNPDPDDPTGDRSDETPDKYQTIFKFVSAGNGTVTGDIYEAHTDETHSSKPAVSPEAKVTTTAAEGYAFDYWTDDAGNKYWTLDEIRAVSTSTDTLFTAHFAVDTHGIDPKDPDKPDEVPDKYQVKVTYQAVNGTVTLAGNTGTELYTYVTLLGADGKPSESGTGTLAKEQIPTAKEADNYDAATKAWTPAEPAEGTAVTASATYTVTWQLSVAAYQVHYFYDGIEDTASAVNASATIGTKIPYDTAKTTFNNAHYTLERVDGEGLAVVKDAAANRVSVYFTKDVLVDPGKDPDPDQPGDDIPDKYQAVVTFAATNGSVRPYGGTDADNTDRVTTVVTLLGADGKPAAGGTGYLTDTQIASAVANDGYNQDSLTWTPAAPTKAYAITANITFTAAFTAIPAVEPTPEEPVAPVPPAVVPVGPAAPVAPVAPAAPAEVIPEAQAPAAAPAQEEIQNEEAPLAAPAKNAWALLNLILMILTALGSLLLLVGYIGKKKKEEEAENGETQQYNVKRKGFVRALSLIPAVGSIIVFILTEDLRNPMVWVDRWTLLMAIIAVIQVIVALLARKEKEEEDPDDHTANA